MRAITRTVLTVIWAAALLAGGYAMVLRLTEGHRPAAYGSYVVWGLGVAQYIYFVGISAGAFMLATLFYAFGIKKLEAIARPALLVAFVGLASGLLSIWVDLGKMGRAFSVLTRPNFSSMMTWMIWLYTAYAILLGVTAYLAYKQSPRVKVAAMVGVPLVLSFSGGVGALFATLDARPLWNTPLYPVFFILGALLSASGLLMALLALQDRTTTAISDALGTLSKIVLLLLAIDVLLEWAEYSIGLWYGVGGEQVVLKQILFGSYWWVFWLVHVVLGVVVPAFLLLRAPRNPVAQGSAGFLVVATYMAVRLNLVIPGLISPELKGLETAYTGSRLVFTYSPSLFEWGIFLFAVALAVGLIWVGYRYLPLAPASRKEEKVA